jgi:hypothetical protein
MHAALAAQFVILAVLTLWIYRLHLCVSDVNYTQYVPQRPGSLSSITETNIIRTYRLVIPVLNNNSSSNNNRTLTISKALDNYKTHEVFESEVVDLLQAAAKVKGRVYMIVMKMFFVIGNIESGANYITLRMLPAPDNTTLPGGISTTGEGTTTHLQSRKAASVELAWVYADARV